MPKKEDEFEKLLKKYKKYAASKGFKLNSSKRLVKGIIEGLIANKQKYRRYFCPCRLEHTKHTLCPCAYHKKEIEKFGKCLCGLFVKKKK